MLKLKYIIVIVLLLTVIIVSYSVPKAKYVGTNFIPELNIPFTFSTWQGKDVSQSLNINAANTNFNFINNGLAYSYVNHSGQNLLFIVLDAGNFHHPKVCFTGAGYKIRELPDSDFHIPSRNLKAHTLYTEKENASFLSLYWIVIDKNLAHDWIEQKFKQFYYSLFNKQRIGLMIRIDIPVTEDTIKAASMTAKQFIGDLSVALKPKDADYILGSE